MATEILNTKDQTLESLIKKGVKIGSAVFGLTTGKTYKVTMTGKIEIRPFTNSEGEEVKSAYFLTKEGISPKVNGSFDKATYAEGKKHDVMIMETEIGGVVRKYASLVSVK